MNAPLAEWGFRPATLADAEWMSQLRAVVMRADLERLGRFDDQRVRTRFLDAFVPEHTRVIVADGAEIGLIAVRDEADGIWIEHFYLRPERQGRGIGSAVLERIKAERAGHRVPLRLNVLQGSAARRLYERHGFVLDSEDPVDVYLRVDPATQ